MEINSLFTIQNTSYSQSLINKPSFIHTARGNSNSLFHIIYRPFPNSLLRVFFWLTHTHIHTQK